MAEANLKITIKNRQNDNPFYGQQVTSLRKWQTVLAPAKARLVF